jgi:hypothetical protein
MFRTNKTGNQGVSHEIKRIHMKAHENFQIRIQFYLTFKFLII